MDSELWESLHGASTHFPIALLLAATSFDLAAFARPARFGSLHTAGYFSILVAAGGALAAVVSGLVMTRGSLLGGGPLFWHHVFVWPASLLMVGMAVWRIVVGANARRGALRIYLAFACLTSLLVLAAGYWGGKLLLSH
jgi:uncharacterized membrane protein